MCLSEVAGVRRHFGLESIHYYFQLRDIDRAVDVYSYSPIMKAALSCVGGSSVAHTRSLEQNPNSHYGVSVPERKTPKDQTATPLYQRHYPQGFQVLNREQPSFQI